VLNASAKAIHSFRHLILLGKGTELNLGTELGLEWLDVDIEFELL